MKKKSYFLAYLILFTVLICGCGNVEKKNHLTKEADGEVEIMVEDSVAAAQAEAMSSEDKVSDNISYEENSTVEATNEESAEVDLLLQKETNFLGKYDSFDAWRQRHMGSVGRISDKTILVSVYLDEPNYHWDEESMKITQKVMKIAYDFLSDTMKTDYQTEMNLLYDVNVYEDLLYRIQIEETIPTYVTTEDERKIDVLEDEWITELPVEELMEKYEADSIGFLFFVPHEGCSYSSMHFIDDGITTWDESCLLYLKDMYSPTLEYETPAVYAHELLHLFGAEDLYLEAEVFSKDAYEEVKKIFPQDIMIKTYDTIDGKYIIYSDEVKQKVSPITAYLVGTPGIAYPLENQELVKKEEACFSGSTYDRPF